jgi:hypothetical protein
VATACDVGVGGQLTGPNYASDDTTFATPRGEMIIAIILSNGKNGSSGSVGANESRNIDGQGNVNAIFVSRLPEPASAAGGEFDDIVTWIAYPEFVRSMIAAGSFP